MPLTDAQGRPIGKSAQQVAPQLMGLAVFRKAPGNVLTPIETKNGMFAIFPNIEMATGVAQQMAQAELLPDKDKKVVTPMLTSSEYVLVQMFAIGVVQAQIKSPDQLLAPEGKLNG